LPFESNPTVRSHVCPECGAPLGDGETCLDLFNRMLALEWQAIALLGDGPSADSVPPPPSDLGLRTHFFAVATYQLQHPDGLEAGAVLGLRESIGDMLAGRTTIAETRAKARRLFDGPRRVRRQIATERDPALGPSPEHWPMTVADCCDVAPEAYFDVVRRWTESAMATIAAVRSTG
jgi:hypothetical protein